MKLELNQDSKQKKESREALNQNIPDFKISKLLNISLSRVKELREMIENRGGHIICGVHPDQEMKTGDYTKKLLKVIKENKKGPCVFLMTYDDNLKRYDTDNTFWDTQDAKKFIFIRFFMTSGIANFDKRKPKAVEYNDLERSKNPDTLANIFYSLGIKSISFYGNHVDIYSKDMVGSCLGYNVVFLRSRGFACDLLKGRFYGTADDSEEILEELGKIDFKIKETGKVKK